MNRPNLTIPNPPVSNRTGPHPHLSQSDGAPSPSRSLPDRLRLEAEDGRGEIVIGASAGNVLPEQDCSDAPGFVTPFPVSVANEFGKGAEGLGHALYLYGFVREFSEEVMEGIDPRFPLFAVTVGKVSAVCSRVDIAVLEAFAAQQPDLALIAPFAVRHQEIVAGLGYASSILPARFGTLFSGEDSLCALLERNEQTITDFLGQVEGADEWAVKGYFAPMSRSPLSDTGASSGRRYLESLSQQKYIQQERESWLEPFCLQVAGELLEIARDFRALEALTLEEESTERQLRLNWSFLVPHHREQEFAAILERAEREAARNGLTFAISGPWPPYSFAPVLT